MAAPNSSSSASLIMQDEELQKVFDQFDSNKDGKISKSELAAVLKSMGSTYTEAELERVMEDVDSDKDGFINLEEFGQICKSSTDSKSANAELKDAFDLYDENKDGLISKTELHHILNRLGMKCSVDECFKMIQSVDSDGDGSVNYLEFQKMMSADYLKK